MLVVHRCTRIVLAQKFLFGILIAGYHAHFEETININPGQVKLVRKESCPGTPREKMMIIMPFAGKHTRSRLVDGKVRPVKINSIHMFILALTMTCIIECPYQDEPEKSATETCQCQSFSSKQPKYTDTRKSNLKSKGLITYRGLDTEPQV